MQLFGSSTKNFLGEIPNNLFHPDGPSSKRGNPLLILTLFPLSLLAGASPIHLFVSQASVAFRTNQWSAMNTDSKWENDGPLKEKKFLALSGI